MTVPPALVPDLEQYVTNQFQQVVAGGRAAFVASLGTEFQVYSMSQLHLDLVFFAAIRAAGNSQASVTSGTARWFSAMYHSLLSSLISELRPAEAQAQRQDCPYRKKGDGLGSLLPGCSESEGNEPFFPPEIPILPECMGGVVERYNNPQCRPTEDDCEGLGGHKVMRRDDGSAVCVPKNPPKSCPKDPLKLAPGKQCLTFPLKPRLSRDPNDKAGTLGATPARFLLNATPLSYAVSFENLATATAAAQEVMITDQLDVAKVNLGTFGLGPIAFADTTVIPAPGVQHYTGGVDLRPDQNLVVTIHADLDEGTGLVTWRFTSSDPGTGQLTEDPDAGFLPPNVNPPEGDGSVAFTVRPQPGMVTGTTICNQASIVFDVNAPIVTAQWCNSIDNSPPRSHVLPLPPMQTETTFLVQWEGTDDGAGVGDFTVYVSEDGGAFVPLVSDSPDTSMMFTGQVGKTYAFCSLSRDLLGTVEAKACPPDADTMTTIVLAATQTETPTETPTEIATDTPTPTATARNTTTETPTCTPTVTGTDTPTSTPMPSNTPTAAPTNTPTPTATTTQTPTNTSTQTLTPTQTPTSTATTTPTAIATRTPTNTPSATTTSTPAQTLSQPTNKAQCKKGGWQDLTFPRPFKNQGECIQFVSTGK